MYALINTQLGFLADLRDLESVESLSILLYL